MLILKKNIIIIPLLVIFNKILNVAYYQCTYYNLYKTLFVVKTEFKCVFPPWIFNWGSSFLSISPCYWCKQFKWVISIQSERGTACLYLFFFYSWKLANQVSHVKTWEPFYDIGTNLMFCLCAFCFPWHIYN